MKIRYVRHFAATLAASFLILASASCAAKSQFQTVQITHDSLAAAQNLEAGICWGVTSIQDPRMPADTTRCTTDLARTVGLTQERHRAIHAKLATAFDLHRSLTAQISSGGTADLSVLSQIVIDVLALLSQLDQSSPQVVRLTSAVKAGRIQ